MGELARAGGLECRMIRRLWLERAGRNVSAAGASESVSTKSTAMQSRKHNQQRLSY